ncbi:FliH/SctL family protein [Lysobacter sp.]|uniref:FliH/SctL family protein n=1 Tax=Lysobacter sp. TaxID=72226 RepID=UPI002D21F392|nr:FliH/SctL family protein [Lysobacter sp.]HZX75880.1 FliH/SctL family protein [Lysobacter sp.]
MSLAGWSDELAGAVRWTAPGLEPPAPEPVLELPTPPSVEELQAIEEAAREQGYADGLARGHAEGFATGQAEVRRLVAQIEGILDGFTRPLSRLDDEVSEALAELAVRVAGSLLGPAYSADPALLADLVREALDAVGTSQRDVELRLHPDDMGVLYPHLAGLDGVRLTNDSTLARGELRVHSESVRIDGTLAARLQAVLESTVAAHGVVK